MFDTLANLVVYQWLGLDTESHAGAALQFDYVIALCDEAK